MNIPIIYWNSSIGSLLYKCKNSLSIKYIVFISLNSDIIFDIYGYKNQQPIWSHDFYNALYKSKMALNLSRINNVKYYSSNRIASLIGNGILTFVDINTKLNDFFNNDEVIFYKNINDLSKKN